MPIPSPDQIRVRAYQIYLERGRKPGHEIDDWLQAEYELRQLPVRKLGELPSGDSPLLNLVQAALFLGENI
ncbi:MAG: DUF2934 domain-containing protein [Verrucomicrobia bacterium]|nr:DUF2934 domain-containing protein [Verrucomicrobiota bacterium]